LLAYLRTLFLIASPLLFGLWTIYMLAQWFTALIWLAVLVCFVIYAVRRYEKYHEADKFNDQKWR
jgi:hypothetical protein